MGINVASGRKRITTTLVTDGDMSGSVNSTALDLHEVSDFAIQAVWTGTPTGTLVLQGSCDNVELGTDVTNWVNITDSSYTVTVSDSNYLWDYSDAAFLWVRLAWTNTTGSGTLQVVCSAKQ